MLKLAPSWTTRLRARHEQDRKASIRSSLAWGVCATRPWEICSRVESSSPVVAQHLGLLQDRLGGLLLLVRRVAVFAEEALDDRP